MSTSYRVDCSHISPSSLAVCLLTSTSFPLSFLIRSQKSGRCCEDIGQMPWQQRPKEVSWFGCLQGYAASGIILVLCGVKIVLFIYMLLLGKKDFSYGHAVVFGYF